MKNDKTLFLSRTIPTCIEEEVFFKQTKTMQSAAISFQHNLISGIESNLNNKIFLFNLLPVNSYPTHYKDPFIKKFFYSHGEGATDYNVGYTNICYIKQILLPLSYLFQLKKYWKQNEFDIVICYTANLTMLKAIKWIKKKYPKTKTCLIIPDMPEFSDLSKNKSFLKKKYIAYTSKRTRNYIKYIDSFVYLTEPSAKYFCESKKYVVVEGIIPEAERTYLKFDELKNKKIVSYTGTTNHQFGIVHLLEAFSKILGEDYRLIICGCGDSDELIKEKAKKDSRIIFKGVVSHEEALAIQQQSTVLINPRQNIGEYTKYSFPSKNLEYLASGVPVIAYKLDGIPDEYNNYINYVEDNSVDSLTNKIEEICGWTEEKRRKHLEMTDDFIHNKKNKVEQTKKIVNMLKENF